MSSKRIRHEFVDFVPEDLEDGVLYISVHYGTTVHRCLCGCGREVVLPLSPADWRFTYDGERVSLYPSIGNWDFSCRSHYWIREDTVRWARSWSDMEIEGGKASDRRLKAAHFDGDAKATHSAVSQGETRERLPGRIRRLMDRLRPSTSKE